MKDEKVKVYVWELPVRFTHWINVLCLLALSVTGYYVARPFIHAVSSEQYIMGWMRFIHFVAAYAFLMSILIRLYWAFAGNKHASIKSLFPVSGQNWKYLVEELKFYLFMSNRAPRTVGHTVLQGWADLGIILVFLFQIASGFAMYSVTHTGMIWTLLGGWLLGYSDLQTLRLYHHLSMYVVIAFAIVHIYIAWLSSSVKQNGLMMSIFNGYKYIPKKRD